MSHATSSPHSRHAGHSWRSLKPWERVVVVAVLLGALVVSAALVYFQPDGNPGPPTIATPVDGSPNASPPFPPGTRWYYQRGQWVPQDQQLPIQP